jgi:hypothetical protein
MTSLDEFQEVGVFLSPKTLFIPRSYRTIGDF